MDWPTVIIASLIAAVFVAIVVTKIVNLRRGKLSCSCGGNCGACNLCHGTQTAQGDAEEKH